MRRVNIVTGIKQRLNGILGHGTAGALNDWSIQSAMLSNFRRICLALLNGSSMGRILSGLSASYSSTIVTIASGYGVTVNGDIITLPAPKNVQVSSLSEGDNYICLKYELKELPSGGKITPVINETGTQQIVFDESGAADDYDDIVEIKSSVGEVTADNDLVYIATATVTGGVITGLTTTTLSTYGKVIVKEDAMFSVDTGVATIIPFSEVLKDTAQEYNSSTGVYTANASGFRQVSWLLSHQGVISFNDDEKYIESYLSINDAVDENYCFRGATNWGTLTNPPSQNIRDLTGSALLYLSGGDTLSLKVYHNTGNALYFPSRIPPYPSTDYFANSCYMTISTVPES